MTRLREHTAGGGGRGEQLGKDGEGGEVGAETLVRGQGAADKPTRGEADPFETKKKGLGHLRTVFGNRARKFEEILIWFLHCGMR